MMGSKQLIPQMPSGLTSSFPAIKNAKYLTDVPEWLQKWECTRALLVVSRSLDKNTDKVSRLESVLGSKITGKKSGVGSHSPYADVLDIASLIQTTGADSVICIGSSSYSDACKTARLLAANLSPKDLNEDHLESLVDQQTGWSTSTSFKGPTVKLICIPCSLSVSEYNPVSSATNRSGKKQHFGSLKMPDFAPSLILLDPEIASTAPAESLWLPSGARAIDHAVESIVSESVSPEGKEVAQRGLRALLVGLKRYHGSLGLEKTESYIEQLYAGISACQQGARDAISAIFCYGSHVGPSHAIGHQLGGVGKVPHGMTSCVILPSVLRYEKNGPKSQYWNVESQVKILDVFREALGWEEDDAGTALERFFKELGLPTRLSEVGIHDEKMLKIIAEKTLTDIWGGGPKQITDAQEIMNILEMAK
jgi:alcohol dehydrogenase class IV